LKREKTQAINVGDIPCAALGLASTIAARTARETDLKLKSMMATFDGQDAV